MAKERTPFTDPGIWREIVSKQISMVAWTQAPVVKLFGLNGDKKFDFENWPPGNGKKIQLLEDTMAPLATTLGAAVADGTTLAITLANPTYVHNGHMLKIDNEVMIVGITPAGSATTTIAQRGAGGTTPAAHLINAPATIVGIAKTTGDKPALGYTTTMTKPANWVQTIEEAANVEDEQQGVTDYGVGSDTMGYHLAKLIGGRSEIGGKGQAGTLLKHLGMMAYSPIAQDPNVNGTKRGIAGGLPYFIQTNREGLVTDDLTRPRLHSMVRKIYKEGGMVDTILTSAWGAELITRMYEGSVYTEISEERGGSVITWIRTPVVERINIEIDWQCKDTETYLLDKDKVAYVPVTHWHVVDFAKVDYTTTKGVHGEYSFMVANEKTHAMLFHKGES